MVDKEKEKYHGWMGKRKEKIKVFEDLQMWMVHMMMTSKAP
jgi:hypothetical protein